MGKHLLVRIGLSLLLVGSLLFAGALPTSAAATYTVSVTIPLDDLPQGVGVNPATGKVYVADYGHAAVWVIDETTNAIVATIPVGTNTVGNTPNGINPLGLAVDPVTDRIYVANLNGAAAPFDGNVSVIDGSTDTLTESMAVGDIPNGITNYPSSVAIDPTTHIVYVGSNVWFGGTSFGGSVTAIDESTNTIITTVPVAGTSNPWLAVDPTTHTLFATTGTNGTVLVMDGSTLAVTDTISDGTDPSGVAIDPITHTVLVSDPSNNSVSVIDETTDTVTSTIPVGGRPAWIADDSAINTFYVANSDDGTVSVIDGASETVVDTVVVGSDPLFLDVDPNTHAAYVGNVTGKSVSVITVSGIPASADAGGPFSGQEGLAIPISGSGTFVTGWTVTDNDGTDGTCTIADSSSISTGVTCNDEGSYTLTLTSDNGVDDPVSSTAVLTVTNAPITVGTITVSGAAVPSTPVTTSASFSDPGTADAHVATWDWGDTTQSAGTVTETVGTGTGTVSGSHTYAAAGIYTVTVTVSDQDEPPGSGSAEATVGGATPEALCTLTREYVTNRLVAYQLCAILRNVTLAEHLHSSALKAYFVKLYVVLVDNQKNLTSEQKSTLVQVAESL